MTRIEKLAKVWAALPYSGANEALDYGKNIDWRIKMLRDQLARLEGERANVVREVETSIREGWTPEEIAGALTADPETRRKHLQAAKRRQRGYRVNGGLANVDPLLRNPK